MNRCANDETVCPRPAIDIVSGRVPSLNDFGALTPHRDQRGVLTEIYRQSWPDVPLLRQWNHVRNGPNVLRGMHVHTEHHDFMVVVDGEILLGLRDIRRDSASYGTTGLVRLSGERLSWALIRPGVVHGFYIPNGATMLVGLSHGWSMSDEIECRWDDRSLGIDWPPISDPILSSRDQAAGTFEEMNALYESRAGVAVRDRA